MPIRRFSSGVVAVYKRQTAHRITVNRGAAIDLKIVAKYDGSPKPRSFETKETDFNQMSAHTAALLSTTLTVIMTIVLAGSLLGCLLKGKYLMAFVSLIWPWAWTIGAIRIAKPDSFWARRFYTDEKLALANERFQYKQEQADLKAQIRSDDDQEILDAWEGIEIEDPNELDPITRKALKKAGRI